MDRTILEQLVTQDISISAIAKQVGLSPTTVRYWLKQYDLKTLRVKRRDTKDSHFCSACNLQKPVAEFYERKRGGYMGWCMQCSSQSAQERQRENKRRAVEKHGGKCTCCGYNKYIGALDFHHPDPATKDPSFAKMKMCSWDNFWAEVEQCVLLCANCHREAHAKQ